MKLSYQGINYESEPSMLEVTEGEIGGMYRGRNWRFHYVRHIPEPLPVRNLNYRGVACRTDQFKGTIPTVVARTLPTHDKPEILDETTSSHLKSIRRSLEHRLQVAKAKGDKSLVRLLEVESEQMAFTFG